LKDSAENAAAWVSARTTELGLCWLLLLLLLLPTLSSISAISVSVTKVFSSCWTCKMEHHISAGDMLDSQLLLLGLRRAEQVQHLCMLAPPPAALLLMLVLLVAAIAGLCTAAGGLAVRQSDSVMIKHLVCGG
jgi:hypothetical protein